MLPPYIQDILAQPQALQATLEGLKETEPLSAFTRGLSNGKYQRVVLTGMGSSYHALYPLLLRLIDHGIYAQAMDTSELIYHASALIEPRTLLVAVSQSGESAEMIRLLDKARGKTEVIGLTNTPGSRLAREANATVFTNAGEETSVSCKTYVTALAALAWLGDQLSGEQASGEFPALDEAPGLMSHYLEGWQRHTGWLVEQLSGIRNLFLVGRGISLAAAGTGALIIKESARFPAEGMSSASFRHGPLEMVSAQVFVAAFAGMDEMIPLNMKLVEDIRSLGGRAGIIREGHADSPFDLPAGGRPVLPFLEILPAQMISLALAEIQGIEPGRFERISKVTTAD